MAKKKKKKKKKTKWQLAIPLNLKIDDGEVTYIYKLDERDQQYNTSAYLRTKWFSTDIQIPKSGTIAIINSINFPSKKKTVIL